MEVTLSHVIKGKRYALQFAGIRDTDEQREVPGTSDQVSPLPTLSHCRVLRAWFSLTTTLFTITDPQTPRGIAEHPCNMVLLLFQSGRRKLGFK